MGLYIENMVTYRRYRYHPYRIVWTLQIQVFRCRLSEYDKCDMASVCAHRIWSGNVEIHSRIHLYAAVKSMDNIDIADILGSQISILSRYRSISIKAISTHHYCASWFHLRLVLTVPLVQTTRVTSCCCRRPLALPPTQWFYCKVHNVHINLIYKSNTATLLTWRKI